MAVPHIFELALTPVFLGVNCEDTWKPLRLARMAVGYPNEVQPEPIGKEGPGAILDSYTGFLGVVADQGFREGYRGMGVVVAGDIPDPDRVVLLKRTVDHVAHRCYTGADHLREARVNVETVSAPGFVF